jgi:hypothetical protein
MREREREEEEKNEFFGIHLPKEKYYWNPTRRLNFIFMILNCPPILNFLTHI